MSDVKFRILPELLPMGHEDKTQLTVGVQIDEKEEKSVARIGVWIGELRLMFIMSIKVPGSTNQSSLSVSQWTWRMLCVPGP